MCNLYNMTEKGEAERFLGTIGVDLEDYSATTVGPFQTGLYVKPGKSSDTTRLVGRLGQWGMIRPGSSRTKTRVHAVPPRLALAFLCRLGLPAFPRIDGDERRR